MKTFLIHLINCVFGLILYSIGIILTIRANIGYAPWDVFHAGLSLTAGLSFGTVSIIVGVVIVAALTILGEKFGIGTILNVILIGIFLDIMINFDLVPIAPNRITGVIMSVSGLFIIALGSYFYIKAGLGVGPRDNLMVVLAKKTKIPVGICRIIVEAIVTIIGWKLGGMVWFGTILFVVTIGFAVQVTFRVLKFDVTAVKHESLFDTWKLFFGKK